MFVLFYFLSLCTFWQNKLYLLISYHPELCGCKARPGQVTEADTRMDRTTESEDYRGRRWRSLTTYASQVRITCSILWGDGGHSPLCMAAFGIFSIAPCCWIFLSTFLPPLPFLDLSSGNPPILAVVLLVFYNLLVCLSQIFLVISCLIFVPFHPALNYFTNYTSFSSNFFSQVVHSFLVSPFSLHQLFSLSSCSRFTQKASSIMLIQLANVVL